MINVKKISSISMAISFAFGLSACNAGDSSSTGSLNTESTDSSLVSNLTAVEVIEVSEESSNESEEESSSSNESQLDKAEQHHLIFMREEEKLARDVYASLAGMWPDASVFVNIGEGSEQTHADIMRDKLEEFNIEDPNPETNNLPSSIGVFTGELYGSYFAEKYQLLINQGSQSELDALYVGALIEELDMHDIVECPEIIEDTDNGISDCGLNYTDEPSLINAYSSLLDGSKSHLKAYVGRIESIVGEGNYEAQILSQDDVNEILGR